MSNLVANCPPPTNFRRIKPDPSSPQEFDVAKWNVDAFFGAVVGESTHSAGNESSGLLASSFAAAPPSSTKLLPTGIDIALLNFAGSPSDPCSQRRAQLVATGPRTVLRTLCRGVVPFSRLYPQSPVRVDGVAYKAGKSDTPALATVPRGLFFLVVIGTGVFYIAVKFVEYRRSPPETYVPAVLRPIVEEHGPGTLYGVMVVDFYCGVLRVDLYSFGIIAR